MYIKDCTSCKQVYIVTDVIITTKVLGNASVRQVGGLTGWLPVIRSANAVVYPFAMMVKIFNASVASFAMLR